MSISSVSLTFFSLSSAPGASPTAVAAPAPTAAPVAASPTAPAERHSCEGHGPGRRNVLFDAMMSALRELGLTKQPDRAAPVDGTAGGVPSATAAPAAQATSGSASSTAAVSNAGEAVAATPAPTATAPNLEDAVNSFAHALWQALRGMADGGTRDARDQADDGEHHRRHQHQGGRDDGYGMTHDYSGLANRLEALAVRVEAASTASVAPAASAPPVAVQMPVNAGPVMLPGTEPVIAQTDMLSTQTAASPPVVASTAAASPAEAKNPLAEAFSKLLTALRGAAGEAPAQGATEPSLSDFLHNLARGLGAEPAAAAPSFTAVGLMINITA